MQKAMFLTESYRKGILSEIDAGYILTVNVPDMTHIQRKFDPYRIEMVSYSGVRSIHPVEGGLKFNSAGMKILCMVEPTNYPGRHIEPAFRSTKTTGHMPFRLKECEITLTSNDKFRVLLPNKPIECIDSFTIEFPRKGDVSVLYFIFNDNINEVVLPYIAQNVGNILRSIVNLPTAEATRISRDFLSNVERFQVPVRNLSPISQPPPP
ncbi:MAG: hypothetical protein KOO61_01960 [Spirochaetales bacterium]|nr:hypothetical protein [Spirochaetales bacterium]